MSLSAAIRVDDNGAVLASGYRSTDRATPTNQMYFLIRNGQITDLSPALHGLYAMMNALNSHDDIAGEIGLNAPESHAMRPYLYRNGQQIPIKSVNGMPVTATALNDHGEVTGGFQRSQAGGVDSTHAFRWRGGRMVDIDGRPAGTSQGQAIDNLGAIWGWRQIDSGYENTFLDGKGPGAITSSDTVTAFNARGDACGKRFVGTYESNNGGSVQQREHAMYWSHGKALDLSPSGANNEAAIALNNHAQVVGRGEGGPFLWAQGKRTPISSLISARAGWQVLTVTGINDRGEIVGVAFKDRAVRACILTRIGRQ
jgi:probable HAF family extracellular repeat protein